MSLRNSISLLGSFSEGGTEVTLTVTLLLDCGCQVWTHCELLRSRTEKETPVLCPAIFVRQTDRVSNVTSTIVGTRLQHGRRDDQLVFRLDAISATASLLSISVSAEQLKHLARD
jgi:hypothetical protein